MRKEKPGCALSRNLVFAVRPIWTATKKPGVSKNWRKNSRTDEQKSYSRPYRDGRVCRSIQSPVLLDLLADKNSQLVNGFLKGSPYPIGTVNLLFCVGERRYAFGLCSSIEKSCKRVSKKGSTFNTQYNCSACVGRAPTLTFWSPKALFQKNTIFQKWHDIYKWQMDVCVELLSIASNYGRWWVYRILQRGRQPLY